jgi:serine phosphatase RsbU (regulator of sigma subunit)
MFPQDRLEVRLFAPPNAASGSGVAWPALTLTYPPGRPPLADADWSHLHGANQAEITVPDVVPPGTSARYGDAVIVAIATDDPGAEGGAKEQLLGGIALLRHHDNGQTVHSLAALQALASQIGSAYYRAQVHLETLEAQKMAQELELAGRIQATFLPGEVPAVAGWDIAAGLTPARQTSGDFYDFISLPDGRVGIVVADVADKGTGAALYMALSRTLIRTFAVQHPDAPETVLRAANARLLSDAESDQFVTVFYAVLDPASDTLHYANAGHNPGFVLRPDAGHEPVASLERTGVPLGIFDGMDWGRASVTLAADDVLVLYTDGVSEAQDIAQAEYGETRLCQCVHGNCADPADAILSAVTRDVQSFAGDAPQFDDITLMVAVRKAARQSRGATS